ncbi:MAG TPA: hemin uptake protein HemP [Rhodocyclaceae bacterium]|nr:hemin uptake protein HemP [Rhodocyclaceae bacterium]
MSNTSRNDATAPVITLTPGENGLPPLVSSEQLFQAQGALRIVHEGGVYLLRVTRENKLILTK